MVVRSEYDYAEKCQTLQWNGQQLMPPHVFASEKTFQKQFLTNIKLKTLQIIAAF